MQLVAKVKGRENPKHSQRNHLLDHLQLIRRKGLRANPVGGDLQAVFKEGEPPADQDHLPQRHLTQLRVPVPRKRNKDVRADQKQNGPHERCVSSRSMKGQKDKMQRACLPGRSPKTSLTFTNRLPKPAVEATGPRAPSACWPSAKSILSR